MRFDFNEAPDYASILEDSFAKANRGFERREAAERENDKRRIENAGMSIELIKDVLAFAPKAKGLADQLKLQQQERQQNYYTENLADLPVAQQQLIIDHYHNGKDIMAEDYIAKWSIAHKIKNDDGLHTTALDLVDQSEWRKGKHGFLEAAINRTINNAPSVFFKDNPDLSNYDENDVERLYNIHIKKTVGEFNKYPEALQLILRQGLKKQAELGKAEHRKGKNEEREQKYRYDRTQDSLQFIKAKSGAEFNAGVIQRLELIKAEQNFDTLSQAIEYMSEDILALVESGELTVAQARKFEAVTFMHRGKKGTPTEELFASHSKAFSKTGWDDRLHEAQKAAINRDAETKTLYQKSFNNGITQIEQERGYLMSGPELANYIKENYDMTQGGPISDDIKNRLTYEEHEDDLTVPMLENLWNKGLLTEREVRKLNSEELRETWTKRIGTVGPEGIGKDELKNAVKQAESFANAKSKSEGKPAGRNNSQWTNIVDNAKYLFPSLYADEMKTAPDARTAYINAVARMKALIEADAWNELVGGESEPLKRNKDLLFGEKHLEVDPNAFQKDIIYGSEDILQQAELLHEKGEAHLYYKQLAPKIKIDGVPIHPLKLQEIQLNIKRKKEGLGEVPKSEILKAYEKLPPSVRTTLAQKVTPSKLIQAKIDAFGSDNDITYNEVEFLLEGILDTEFNRKDYKMTEEVEEKPKVITAQQKQRLLARESRRNEAVALKTRQIISDFFQSPGIYLQDVFATELAAFSMLGEGLEERREQVKKEGRVNKRKRN